MRALGGGAGGPLFDSWRANFPASGRGGGALNLVRGGSGDSLASFMAWPDRLGAGGGGGLEPPGGDGASGRPPGGGGGGGGREPLEDGSAGGAGRGEGAACGGACCCCCSRKKSTINSWFSLMKSSVKPLSFRSWPKCSRHKGSNSSSKGNSEGGLLPLRLMADMEAEWAGGRGRLFRGDSGGVGPEG